MTPKSVIDWTEIKGICIQQVMGINAIMHTTKIHDCDIHNNILQFYSTIRILVFTKYTYCLINCDRNVD